MASWKCWVEQCMQMNSFPSPSSGPVLLEFQQGVQRGVQLPGSGFGDDYSWGPLVAPVDLLGLVGLQQSCPLFFVHKGNSGKAGARPSCHFSSSIFPPQLTSLFPWSWVFTFEFLMPKMSLYVVPCHSGHFYVSTHCMLCIFYPHYSFVSPLPTGQVPPIPSCSSSLLLPYTVSSLLSCHIIFYLPV